MYRDIAEVQHVKMQNVGRRDAGCGRGQVQDARAQRQGVDSTPSLVAIAAQGRGREDRHPVWLRTRTRECRHQVWRNFKKPTEGRHRVWQNNRRETRH
jgi:hypothetical protein